MPSRKLMNRGERMQWVGPPMTQDLCHAHVYSRRRSLPRGDGSLVQPILGPQNSKKVLGSNPVQCRWNSCRSSANELDLGLPTIWQVKSAVVLQKKKKKTKDHHCCHTCGKRTRQTTRQQVTEPNYIILSRNRQQVARYKIKLQQDSGEEKVLAILSDKVIQE